MRSRRSSDLNGTATVDSNTPLLGAQPRRTRTALSAVLRDTKLVLFNNYVNVLLVFLPVGIIAGALHWNAVLVFVFNFLAIMALASLLSFGTEELAKKVGQTIGGLLNASFGNATELIVSIVALRQGQIKLVQASMLGSILSNLLLVLPNLSKFLTSIRFLAVVLLLAVLVILNSLSTTSLLKLCPLSCLSLQVH
jgi:Sodium/calcium exchanger protein